MPGPRLVGRDHELGALADLIGQIRVRGGAMVVLGEPGIGKSSLLLPGSAHLNRGNASCSFQRSW